MVRQNSTGVKERVRDTARDPGLVHYYTEVVGSPTITTACKRVGRQVEEGGLDGRINMMREVVGRGQLMRVTTYRTLTTCSICNKGYK